MFGRFGDVHDAGLEEAVPFEDPLGRLDEPAHAVRSPFGERTTRPHVAR